MVRGLIYNLYLEIQKYLKIQNMELMKVHSTYKEVVNGKVKCMVNAGSMRLYKMHHGY